jgi:L-serine dehydratase
MTQSTGGSQGAPPSIFNDVIGPVMRGPSSSHCAAALRIGRLARDLMGGEVGEVLVEFHPGGSLATTHESQGSDMGLFGGLLGWDPTDSRLVDSARALEEAGVRAEIRITDFPASHPNTYRLTLDGPGGTHRMTALSTGGGMIEVVEVDGIPISMAGDAHETLVFLGDATDSDLEALLGFMQEEGVPGGEVLLREGSSEADIAGGALLKEGARATGLPRELQLPERSSGTAAPGELLREKGIPAAGVPRVTARSALVRMRGLAFPPPEILSEMADRFPLRKIRSLRPVLPVQAPEAMDVPFLTASGLTAYNEGRAARGEGSLDLWELAVLYERARGGLSGQEVMERAEAIAGIMDDAIRAGLQGTEFADRILGVQSASFRERMEGGRLLDGGILNRIILYVTATMEVKSSLGVIVAAPTAGACGTLPGACFGAAHALGLSTDEVARAILAAGMVGVFIAARSTFAAESCGCQAECGAASGMTAAALVTLAGGTTAEALTAASLALQNTLGLVCDPVGNRVEVPCLGRNVMAAANALSCANMALAGFHAVIPLDEVLGAMDEVGRSIPRPLRCTGLGGLSVTETAKRIERDLALGRRQTYSRGGEP